MIRWWWFVRLVPTVNVSGTYRCLKSEKGTLAFGKQRFLLLPLNHQTATNSQAAARVTGVHVAVKIWFKVVSSFRTIISIPPTLIRTGFFEIEAEYCNPRVPLEENKFQ